MHRRSGLIVRSAHVCNGHELAVAGTRLPVSQVLRYLAFTVSPSFVLDQIAGLTLAGLRAAVGHGAQLAAQRTLSLPTRQAFTDELARFHGSASKPQRVGEAHDVAWLSEHARDVLGHLVEAFAEQADLHVDGVAGEQVKAALLYASYLAKDDWYPPLGGQSDRQRRLRVQLDAPTRSLVDDCYRWRRARAGPQPSGPEDDLDQWAGIVCQVEAGYSHTYWEYVNDLEGRDMLATAAAMVPPRAHDHWAAQIMPWDQRFEAATEPSAVPLAFNWPPWRPLAWWWHRIPTRLQQDPEIRDSGWSGVITRAAHVVALGRELPQARPSDCCGNPPGSCSSSRAKCQGPAATEAGG